MRNRKGESGSPCLRQDLIENYSVGEPLISTETEAEDPFPVEAHVFNHFKEKIPSHHAVESLLEVDLESKTAISVFPHQMEHFVTCHNTLEDIPSTDKSGLRWANQFPSYCLQSVC